MSEANIKIEAAGLIETLKALSDAAHDMATSNLRHSMAKPTNETRGRSIYAKYNQRFSGV